MYAIINLKILSLGNPLLFRHTQFKEGIVLSEMKLKRPLVQDSLGDTWSEKGSITFA